VQAFEGLNAYYGDLHNHCDISYGHGSLQEAIDNARQQLDFCSVTGHALWPDMPSPDDALLQNMADYHLAGFAHLREVWPQVQRTMEANNLPGHFVTFLSFEMHCTADGDYTVLYNGSSGEILYVAGVAELLDRLRMLRSGGTEAIAFPHHIGYGPGQRGINWARLDEELSPLVEIVSIHGCSEADESPRPFLAVNGPSEHEGIMLRGLEAGYFFGVIGSTDHHSAHPGSYGHGRTGLWARSNTRAGIWEALNSRRTWALTGDRISLRFALNRRPMGSRIASSEQRQMEFHVVGGGPLDYVDVVKNGELLRRVSRCDVAQGTDRDLVETKLILEVGWGRVQTPVDWEIQLGISDGRILAVEPRFRGTQVLVPRVTQSGEPPAQRCPSWEFVDPLGVRFAARTRGNPNPVTPSTQGMCLHVQMPAKAMVECMINGRRIELPVTQLLEGAQAGRLGKIGNAAYRLHRAPRRWEYDWRAELEDISSEPNRRDVYYLRVRQLNDQWAWSSPIEVGTVQPSDVV